ncbi:hypothetical protein [Alkalihalobacillus sp. BA299]|nr:hypothetical protein [Alkalihalobacillus sp. BA299]
MKEKKLIQFNKSELHSMEKTFLRWVSVKRLEEDLQQRGKERH